MWRRLEYNARIDPVDEVLGAKREKGKENGAQQYNIGNKN